jgi:hypothetical protein
MPIEPVGCPGRQKRRREGARGATRGHEGHQTHMPFLAKRCMTHPCRPPSCPQIRSVQAWAHACSGTGSRFCLDVLVVVRSRNRAFATPPLREKCSSGHSGLAALCGPALPCAALACPAASRFSGMGLAGIPANGRRSNWLGARPQWSPAPATQSTFSLFFLWAPVSSRLFVSSLLRVNLDDT